MKNLFLIFNEFLKTIIIKKNLIKSSGLSFKWNPGELLSWSSTHLIITIVSLRNFQCAKFMITTIMAEIVTILILKNFTLHDSISS